MTPPIGRVRGGRVRPVGLRGGRARSGGFHRAEGPPRRGVEVRHPGGELYGSDRVMLELVSGWSAAGYPAAVTLGEPGPLAGELGRRGVPVRVTPLPVLRGELRKPRLLVRFGMRVLRDVVAGLRDRMSGVGPTRYISTLTLPSQVLAARLAGRHTVLHVHEAEISRPAWMRAVLAVPALGAHRVIVNSDFTRDVLLDSWPHLRDRVTVVHNPVPSRQPLPPPLPRERPERLELLYMGRLSARKGVDVAVRATVELLRRGVPARLTVVGGVFRGNEDFESHVKSLSTNEYANDAIRFTGFVSDVGPLVAAHQVILVPSRKEESFGNVAVEAVLAGRFVAVADHSGLRNAMVGLESALRVPDSDPVTWANSLEELWGQWSHRQPALAGDQRVLRERHHAPTLCKETARFVFPVVGHE